jgi:hypothetical protein
MEPWTPTQDEIDAIVQRAATQLAERTVRVDWIPLPTAADQLKPPDRDGFYLVGWLVASGEQEQHDRLVFWHPERQEGRLRWQRKPG